VAMDGGSWSFIYGTTRILTPPVDSPLSASSSFQPERAGMFQAFRFASHRIEIVSWQLVCIKETLHYSYSYITPRMVSITSPSFAPPFPTTGVRAIEPSNNLRSH